MSHKIPALHIARCIECDAQCRAANAQAWAHNHSRHYKHRVELTLGWEIRP